MVYDKNMCLGVLVVKALEMGWFGVLQAQRDFDLFICFFFLPK